MQLRLVDVEDTIGEDLTETAAELSRAAEVSVRLAPQIERRDLDTVALIGGIGQLVTWQDSTLAP